MFKRGAEGKKNSLFPKGPVIKIFVIPPPPPPPQLKIKRTTHDCNMLQFNEEPKITNIQLQKSTVLQEVKKIVINLKE